MFPSDWLVPGIDAEAMPLDVGEVERSRHVLDVALKKYPPSLLRKNVDRAYVVGDLFFYGVSAAGTNSADRIYVVNDGVENGFTEAYIEETVHHELSSVFLRNYWNQFPRRVWASINPKDFAYGSSGIDALQSGNDSQMFEPALHRIGFLHEYAQASLEDDFNSISEGLFLGDPDFWDVVDSFEPVGKKVRLAIGFYQRLDSSLTESSFRRLASTPRH